MRVNITIPVFNEEAQLASSIQTLQNFLAAHRTPVDYEIVIANNGSTDKTLQIAQALVRSNARLKLVNLVQPGRGGALKKAWLQSDADIFSYMDVDLSTDLAALPNLIHYRPTGN